MGNSVTTPLGVIRPILFTVYSVNQRLPSGPDAMSPDELPLGMRNSVTTPLGVSRPIVLALSSVNQRVPSGSEVIARALPSRWGSGNSWILSASAKTGGTQIKPLKVSKASRSRHSEDATDRVFMIGFLSYALSRKG